MIRTSWPSLAGKLLLERRPLATARALQVPVALVGLLVDLIDPVLWKRGVRQLDDPLVVRVGEPLLREGLHLGRGLVELVENEHVDRDRLHPDGALHAAEVQVRLPDALQAGRVGIPDHAGRGRGSLPSSGLTRDFENSSTSVFVGK